jgi:hypothetical protein
MRTFREFLAEKVEYSPKHIADIKSTEFGDPDDPEHVLSQQPSPVSTASTKIHRGDVTWKDQIERRMSTLERRLDQLTQGMVTQIRKAKPVIPLPEPAKTPSAPFDPGKTQRV